MNLNPSSHELKPTNITSKSAFDCSSHNDKNSNTTSTSLPSLRSFFYKYFQRNQTRNSLKKKESLSPKEQPLIEHDMGIIPQNSNEYHHTIIKQKRPNTVVRKVRTNSSIKKSSFVSNHRLPRHTTTATFTGQKRCLNDVIEGSRFQNELIANSEEEQQLVRSRHTTRTSSLPLARGTSYYYYQHSTPLKTITTKAIMEDHHRDILNSHHYQPPPNSLTHERSRSQSHSSGQGVGNGGIGTTDTDHSSSFEGVLDEEQCRLNRRTQPSRLSTYKSSRYSQRAVAQFMHERHKARLRRNQKASRMLGKIKQQNRILVRILLFVLGILLAVFLICWLPFTISYPTMIFYPKKFPSLLESIIFWFGYVNSLLNPFLYVYSSRNFRQAIIDTLCCYVRLRSRQQLRYQWSFRVGHN
jgi:hypothetical protein